MASDKEFIKEAMAALTPTVIEAYEQTAAELDAMAEARFEGVSSLDSLGWQHKYQAMYMRILARKLRKKVAENGKA